MHQLQAKCKELGLAQTGLRSSLLRRMQHHFSNGLALEPPAGRKEMPGDWSMHVYTTEQMQRLRVSQHAWSDSKTAV